ncbi:MAG: MtrB/PioB family decaheme-associated outer membrane protein [Aquimonas sp.]|nr:MtrB/PioB family decaheme-associated outer membrane protein [Aquimonas sp.]
MSGPRFAPPAVGVLLFALAAPAVAEPLVEVDTGCNTLWLQYGLRGEDAFRFGPLAGESSGRGGLGLLDLLLCRPLTPADGRHARLALQNLGSAQPRWQLEIGEAGRWRLRADGVRLSDGRRTGQTPLRPAADGSQALPRDWVPGASSAAMPLLLPSLVPVELERRRRSTQVGLAAVLGEGWQLDTRYREQRRGGLRSFAGVAGSTGGNSRAIELAQPLEQRTRDADLAVIKVGPRNSLRIGLLLSHFDNALDAIRWQNPFAGVGGWQAAASHPALMAAQPAPDNRYSQLSLSHARQLQPALHLNADVAWGRLRQDQAFLPYTSVPALATGALALPRASLDGRIDTRLLNLRLAHRPASPWRWDARLRLDERDNRSPVDEYLYIPGDSQQQNAAPNSGTRRFNLTPGWREARLELGAGYHPSRQFGVDLQARRLELDRSGSARSDVDETLLGLRLRQRPSERFDYGMRIEQSQRRGGSYLGSRDFVASHSPDYVATVPGGFENLPGLRQFHLADRRRQRLGLFAGSQLGDGTRLEFDAGLIRDDYRASEFGLTATRIRHLQIDLSQALSAGLWLHAFAGREWLDAEQAGRAFQGGANRLPQAADPNRNWFVSHADRIDSLGLGLSQRSAGSPLRLSASASLSDASGIIQMRTGSALGSAPLPDTRARLLRLEAGVDYRVSSDLELGLHYRAEGFRGADFARDGTAPNTLANVILLGDNGGDYRAHAWLLRLLRRF